MPRPVQLLFPLFSKQRTGFRATTAPLARPLVQASPQRSLHACTCKSRRTQHATIHRNSQTTYNSCTSFSSTATDTDRAGHGALLDPKEILDLLKTELTPAMKLEANPYELDRHGRGESYHQTKPPVAIVYPRCVREVQEVVRLANKYRIPLITFGAGTSVEGHVCALYGGISLDTSLLQSMELPDFGTSHEADELNTMWPDPMATVGSGVTRNTLNRALRHTGLYFVVDPGADATLGGMVACGASGTTAVHYGTMRENILALEAVMPDGSIVKAGTKALKNSAGYDLLGLLCGSEGTLGVITSVTVKLHPIPDHVVTAVCVFNSLHHAARAVAAFKFQNVSLTRCELLDASSIVAFNRLIKSTSSNVGKGDAPSSMKELPTLFLELQAPSDSILDELATRVQEICMNDFDGQSFQKQTNLEDRNALWAARHQLYNAVIALRPGANSAVVTDVCVPLSEFARVIEATAQDVAEQNVVGPIFGHAGDGNFHCILPIADWNKEDPAYLERVHCVNDRMIRRTLEVGGTCTGEHGIGYGKSKYLEAQYGIGAVSMMRTIKQALDPHNIMNPGKVVPVDS